MQLRKTGRKGWRTGLLRGASEGFEPVPPVLAAHQLRERRDGFRIQNDEEPRPELLQPHRLARLENRWRIHLSPIRRIIVIQLWIVPQPRKAGEDPRRTVLLHRRGGSTAAAASASASAATAASTITSIGDVHRTHITF